MNTTPIISPFWIYLLGMVDKINLITEISFWLIFIVFLTMVITALIAKLSYDDNGASMLFSYAKKLSVLFVFSGLLLIVTPSQKTLIGMLVAKNITVERVEKITETGKSIKKELKQDVIDIINSVMENDKNKKEK